MLERIEAKKQKALEVTKNLEAECSVRHVTIRNCSEAERGTRVKMEHVV